MAEPIAFYNEHDPFAAAWLRELIAGGHIAPGVVDERSIEDVRPDELAGFTQCHFFAGIGVWSHALRRAGWPDDRPIWTGSCPCQPFSQAGKGEGFADERHLWPAFYHLIEQCEPTIVAGEQVASGGTGVWFDLVQADLEAMGYGLGLVPLPAAGFGGAHIRDRAFWLAHADSGQRGGLAEFRGAFGNWSDAGWPEGFGGIAASGFTGGMANADGWNTRAERQQCGGEQRFLATDSGIGGLADMSHVGHERSGFARHGRDGSAHGGDHGRMGHNSGASTPMLGRDAADWLFCRDGKWRPVGPGTFPLAHEAPARVGRLRGYGNAIDAETLTQFCAAIIGHLDGLPVLEAARDALDDLIRRRVRVA